MFLLYILYSSGLVTWETLVNITLKLLPALTKMYECPEAIMLLNKKGNIFSLFVAKEELGMGFLQTLSVSKIEL